MLVQQILQSKGGFSVETVPPGMLISEAVAILAEKRIGTVIISKDDGKSAAGILSERDIVRELSKSGAGCLDQTVADHMTTELQTCTRDEQADSVLSRMTEGRFRHMPVVEDGELVGLISLGDVVKARLSELAMEKDALEGMIMGH
ncbi:CBS domain-containing protein [Phaeobacter sp. J2-8]|uniref:CBS domain-containing protein n=1 Tax=Phaeobacter sp. J2-8 TaxID=2931394 RepID=UPI001FD3541A|nr:CBS domain-containing protein [Phaeobacter sp. J2-8]MCJ7871935.1 CBS domain-containing protein [Phaeobacter sp. J2-8]